MKKRCFYTNRKSNYKKEVRFSEELDPDMMERQNFCSNTVSVARPRPLIAKKMWKLSVEKKFHNFLDRKTSTLQTDLLYGILILSLDLVRNPDTYGSKYRYPNETGSRCKTGCTTLDLKKGWTANLWSGSACLGMHVVKLLVYEPLESGFST